MAFVFTGGLSGEVRRCGLNGRVCGVGRRGWMAMSKEGDMGFSRREFLDGVTAMGLATVPAGAANAAPQILERPNWVQVPLDTDSTVFDLSFSEKDPKHGWLVGTKGLVMETTDGGVTWEPRAFQNLDAEEEFNYRFETISFFGEEGWVIGKPPILLRTKDGGKSWTRVSLSPKLPGEPVLVTALGPDEAEMTTTAGAVYRTTNGGLNWKALVKETIDATLNRTVSSGVSGASYFTGSIISVIRDSIGVYIAVSSRGNFFLTWAPGQDFWIPHGRDSSRRIQAMGFVANDVKNGIWMSTRGGGLQLTRPDPDLQSTESFEFGKVDIKSAGYGILDVGFRPGTPDAWATLGGGNLFYSPDGGKSWARDKTVGKPGANLYKIKFFSSDIGFILGAGGVLLRYTGSS
uniref:Photosynthesis system II assembly factor Ycf48/Hcf136-like domain-containing protein n=1 Tax=Compsopogon caeruleus TaxID=31354 RepID=A0A6T6B065_9RHOD|mmetsp:Transcript_13368/g.27168  ORF Transcript_13368/g.27168 Transcript_13368/m.27168 type:complete len:404 (+) Transcript_13368:87-1298(+)